MGIKADIPDVPGMEEFVHYFQRTWISGTYAPVTWNVHESHGGCRTNNHIEGWHSKLKKVVGKAHPNVYEIVRTFKMEQASVEVKVAQMQSGARPPEQSRWTIEKNRRIAELKRRFGENTINLDEYIRGLAGHTNLRI